MGTNVTISGTGMKPSDTYTVGYAPQDTGLQLWVKPSGGLAPSMTDGNGNLPPMTLSLAASPLANVGTAYYICLQDAANSLAQSQTTFTGGGGSASSDP